MIKIDGYVVGDAQVTQRLEGVGTKMGPALERAIGRLVLMLQASVVRDKLSGQVLNVKTGTLRRSIDQHVESQPDSVTGIVSTNLKYAPPHEYGFSGTVSVKEHLRKVTMAWGKTLKTPVTTTVRAHAMTMNIPEKSFLRSALRDMEAAGTIRTALQSAVGDSVK